MRTYTGAVQWFAAARLLPPASRITWEEVGRRDVRQWIAGLLDTYSAAYASNQFRALQQSFKWLADLADEEGFMGAVRYPRSAGRQVRKQALRSRADTVTPRRGARCRQRRWPALRAAADPARCNACPGARSQPAALPGAPPQDAGAMPQAGRTFSACGPFCPWVVSNSTFWFSSSDL